VVLSPGQETTTEVVFDREAGPEHPTAEHPFNVVIGHGRLPEGRPRRAGSPPTVAGRVAFAVLGVMAVSA
jgi:hypothetical protein